MNKNNITDSVICIAFTAIVPLLVIFSFFLGLLFFTINFWVHQAATKLKHFSGRLETSWKNQ